MAKLVHLFFSSLIFMAFALHYVFNFWQKRVYNGKSDPCGPIHITIGDGGNREGLATRYVLSLAFLLST